MKISWALGAAGAAVVLALAWNAARKEKTVLLAVSGDEAAELCAKTGYSPDDFWARAKAVGISAAVLREESLEEIEERGEILAFSRPETEKWRALGLISPGAPLKANALWIKDKGVLARVKEAAARYGVSAASSTFVGYQVLEFPQGLHWRSFLAGANPETAQAVAKNFLAAVFGSADSGDTARVFEGDFQVRVVDVEEDFAQWLRAATSGSDRLLVLRLSQGLGVEENMSLLRQGAQELKKNGLSIAPPLEDGPASVPTRSRSLAIALALLFGPLLTVRGGLQVLRGTKALVDVHLPVASPVLEVAAGVLATTLCAAAGGLIVNAAGGAAQGGLFFRMAPLLLGFLILYSTNWSDWRKKWSAPASYRDIFSVLAALAALAVLARPSLILGELGVMEWARRQGPWWAAWRWREALIGFPCLIHAYYRQNLKWDCPDCEDEPSKKARTGIDPRPWFLLGLLGPLGVIMTLGSAALPFGQAAGQAVLVFLVGAVLGILLTAARHFPHRSVASNSLKS